MAGYVRDLSDLDRTQVAVAGGKGANLGELMRLAGDGVRVPPGFCVTADAYRRVVEQVPGFDEQLEQLSALGPDDRHALASRSTGMRRAVEAVALPPDVAADIAEAVTRLGDGHAYAVRSSATAEDLPGSSFAGQHESYLDVVGTDEVLRNVVRCWASLFTERAVAYRLRNGFDHRSVDMAVVVQRMVHPHAAGVLFTADPVSGDRRVVSIESTSGVGEALVSGRVDVDVHVVRDGAIVQRLTAGEARAARAAVVADGGSGTHAHAPEQARPDRPVLTDPQVLELARLGRVIEAHLGAPQDVEWCLVGDGVHIVQSRPITTLFPIPAAVDDGGHVYVSVGHQQMMTDAMTPFGLSLWQLTTPRPMVEAGNRLFVDVTTGLASPSSRGAFLELLGSSDELLRDALEAVLERDDLLPAVPDDAPAPPPPVGLSVASTAPDPSVVRELMARNEASIARAERELVGVSGPALFDAIVADLAELRQLMFDPRGTQVIVAALAASAWLDEHLAAWLGERGVADALTQSVPGNVTSEMGLALLDVADAVRPHPEVVAVLHEAGDDVLDVLPRVDGGLVALDAMRAFLDRYGMRCTGEIDISRPRWSEHPSTLLPLILSNVTSFEPGEAARRFERGRQRAAATEADVLARLRTLPDGDRKADETAEMIRRVRTLIGYREHPKYAMISRYALYKGALLGEAERLADVGAIRAVDDVWFLRFDELHEAVRSGHVDLDLVDRRRDEFRRHQALRPPRVLTSDGQALFGAYRRGDVPAGALAGLPVSAGVVEGRARVVLDLAQADVTPGDILVTTHTDPSWSPLFVAASGLVTEVGGTTTHGSVIAREYGLPAVVGVPDATRLIRDGQRIRVDGTNGHVELLP